MRTCSGAEIEAIFIIPGHDHTRTSHLALIHYFTFPLEFLKQEQKY